MKSICVFCGSSSGRDPEFLQAATSLGRLLADEGFRLVYGGASVGLMGAVADAVLQAGGEVTGVLPRNLFLKEVAHAGLTDLRIVESMHERKALMASLSDGFIALPGGFGTFEEFFEILTWAQLGLHGKPMGLLNIRDYYSSLLALADHGVREGFVREEHRALILTDDSSERLLEKMRAFTPLPLPKWVKSLSET
jgi:uncharacterized protein (TIGR00730 family)